MATVLKLDDDQLTRIQDYADRYERSVLDILREAVGEFLRREQEAEESRWRDAMDGWEEYKRTGLHVTGEEFRDWLRRLGTDDQTDMPECHT